MGIFGSARGVVNQTEGQIDNMSIQIHNKQFEPYVRTGKSLDQVKELLSTVVTNNQKNNNFSITMVMFCYQNSSRNTTCSFDGISPTAGLNDASIGNINNIQNTVFDKTYLESKNCMAKYDVDLKYNDAGIIKNIYVFAWHK